MQETYQQNDEGQPGLSIHNLVYCSRASTDMNKAMIEKIIATAKYFNPRFGITGLLVFGSGFFFNGLKAPKTTWTA